MHADEIRSLAMSTDSLEAQVTIVKNFASENFLNLQMFSSIHRPAMLSITETCILPVLMFGCENWILIHQSSLHVQKLAL